MALVRESTAPNFPCQGAAKRELTPESGIPLIAYSRLLTARAPFFTRPQIIKATATMTMR